ncbi:MAG: hypothetical protein NZ700_12470 [Gemmataceae bacterium]|nr:hypothetical protein [Gemmataceae bacterium]MDW8264641.1 hypothetical protein [Gemmataceae bacterium]
MASLTVPEARGHGTVEKSSVYVEGEKEAQRHKWIESERAGRDLGEDAIGSWVQQHWWGYLRARWIEHLQGIRFWVELDRGDFGLLQRAFQDDALLLDRIMDRIKAGQENLNIIVWALDWHLPMDRVRYILNSLDINSRRLVCKFYRQGSSAGEELKPEEPGTV